MFGGKYGIGIATKNGSENRLIKHFWTEDERREGKDARMRANDGAVDSQGRFWVGTLCDPQETPFAPEGTTDILIRTHNKKYNALTSRDFWQVFSSGWI